MTADPNVPAGPATGGVVSADSTPVLHGGCVFPMPPRAPRAHALVDTFLRVTGLMPREVGALLGVSANAINAWSTGAAINTAHYERLADLNRRAQKVPAKVFYGRRAEIFAPRDGRLSIYDEWLAESWSTPLEPDGEPAYFEVPAQPGPLPTPHHVQTTDVEELCGIAADTVEGLLVSLEPEGWFQWPTTWPERAARLGHPRPDGYCITCTRYVSCALKDFADLVALTVAKNVADRFGVEIFAQKPAEPHAHATWTDVRAARMDSPEAQAAYQAAADEHDSKEPS